jgi:cellobiose phosphorylase
MQTMFSCQRFDGWFPREYSAIGRLGTHDLRPYVDAGNWALEFLHAYLCYTKDFGLLSAPLAWMDRDDEDTVLTHALRALEYYLAPQNIGEHGLCKLGEGDWLDSVNRAGVKGRGESVMATNQTIISITLMSEILSHLKTLCAAPANADELMANWSGRRAELIRNLRAHAFNAAGYFNSNFNDDGVWLFSDRDPDGEKRISAMGNCWSIASGAAGDLTDSVLKNLESLKASQGYRLFWPPMGKVPIPNVGRAGTGDTLPGRSENGNVYNQGSQGFRGRALAVAGKGDLLFDVLQWMLPYDQDRHPVASVMTPPYAVVNVWQELPPFKNRGGMTFLTGSIAYALRLAYDWMLGIRPRVASLAIDPCVPSLLTSLSASFRYLGHPVELAIRNPNGAQAGAKSMTLNGRPVTTTYKDPFSGRIVFEADDKLFAAANKIVVTL